MKGVRCAIYTRKSSEEGLEQSFNSLDAQREACAAYILSQASEGWAQIHDLYDDGGLSGGTLERPALQRLLADVAGGRIDIIVVYKVDRLTRSLLDFAKLVEAFDRAGVSFVSVTQSFNTTTSMGRLTLNMLLSFAQFEREVTAERIRDKIAASKAKGMWMGGTPPLGYRPDGRTLAIVEEHADLVRSIFRRYLELGSVRLLEEALDRQGVRTPPRVRTNGAAFGDCRFTRGQLYAILKNPIYVGEIHHRGTVYPGLHQAIVSRETFDRTARMLAEHMQGKRRATLPDRSPLAGRIVDEAGEPMVAVHASKASGSAGQKLRYRYYVSRSLQHGGKAAANTGMRLPAREIERLVADALATMIEEPMALAARAGIDITPHSLRALADRCRIVGAELRQQAPAHLAKLVARVHVHATLVEIEVDASALHTLFNSPPSADPAAAITLTCPAELTRTGMALRLVDASGVAVGEPVRDTLPRRLALAHRYWHELRAGEADIATIARREGVAASYITRIVRLAFLSPRLTETILAGRQDPKLVAGTLVATGAVPALWAEQDARHR